MPRNNDTQKTDFDTWLDEHELCNTCFWNGYCSLKAKIERILSCPSYRQNPKTELSAE